MKYDVINEFYRNLVLTQYSFIFIIICLLCLQNKYLNNYGSTKIQVLLEKLKLGNIWCSVFVLFFSTESSLTV
jgi:hypothetical protein